MKNYQCLLIILYSFLVLSFSVYSNGDQESEYGSIPEYKSSELFRENVDESQDFLIALMKESAKKSDREKLFSSRAISISLIELFPNETKKLKSFIEDNDFWYLHYRYELVVGINKYEVVYDSQESKDRSVAASTNNSSVVAVSSAEHLDSEDNKSVIGGISGGNHHTAPDIVIFTDGGSGATHYQGQDDLLGEEHSKIPPVRSFRPLAPSSYAVAAAKMLDGVEVVDISRSNYGHEIPFLAEQAQMPAVIGFSSDSAHNTAIQQAHSESKYFASQVATAIGKYIGGSDSVTAYEALKAADIDSLYVDVNWWVNMQNERTNRYEAILESYQAAQGTELYRFCSSFFRNRIFCEITSKLRTIIFQ